MATQNKIVRLTQRIDALAHRRWGRLTMDSLTDDDWAKLKRLAPTEPVGRSDCAAQWSTDALIRFLIDEGVLTRADFKRRSA